MLFSNVDQITFYIEHYKTTSLTNAFVRIDRRSTINKTQTSYFIKQFKLFGSLSWMKICFTDFFLSLIFQFYVNYSLTHILYRASLHIKGSDSDAIDANFNVNEWFRRKKKFVAPTQFQSDWGLIRKTLVSQSCQVIWFIVDASLIKCRK